MKNRTGLKSYFMKLQDQFHSILYKGENVVYEFTNSWRAGIEVVCVCADARAASLGWRSRTDGHCVPLTLSPIFQEMENHPLSLSMLCTQNRLLEFLKCSASTGSSVGIIIKERGNWFFSPNIHFKTWLAFKKDWDGFKHLWKWKTILFFSGLKFKMFYLFHN